MSERASQIVQKLLFQIHLAESADLLLLELLLVVALVSLHFLKRLLILLESKLQVKLA